MIECAFVLDLFHFARFIVDFRLVRINHSADLRIVEHWPPVRMDHRHAARTAEVMPHRIGGTDCTACIARRRLHVNVAKRRAQRHFAIGDRVHAAAAGNRKIGQAMTCMQRVQEMKEGLRA